MNYEENILQAIFVGFTVATFLLNIGRVLKAIELCKESLVLLNDKALNIEKQLGQIIHKRIYATMFVAYRRVSQNTNAIACGRKLLAIHQECNDTVQEGILSIALAQIYQNQSMHAEAKELLERAIPVMQTTGNRREEAIAYASLGSVFQSVSEYARAKEYHEKALAISIEIGDRKGEASRYGNLGVMFRRLGEYTKAKECQEKALAISIEIGDREGEATNYGNLGTVFQFLGDYTKAKECHEKALAISIESGHRELEALNYLNLGRVFRSFGKYVKAKEYYDKALAISIETGDRGTELQSYRTLGDLFSELEENTEAAEYYDKALAMKSGMEDWGRQHEADHQIRSGMTSYSHGKYPHAISCYEKALENTKKINNRWGEALCHSKLGDVFKAINNMVKAKECHEKALAIATDIGDREMEGFCLHHLGAVYQCLGECVMAEECLKKALSINKDVGNGQTEFHCYLSLALTMLSEQKFEEAFSYLDQSTRKFEELRGLVGNSDLFKISFADKHASPYHLLSVLFCFVGNPREALYAAELGRARALADLMETKYSAQPIISADQHSCTGLENVMKKEGNCACLYISYFENIVLLWILKKCGAVSMRKIKVDEKTLQRRLEEVARNLDEFFTIMAKPFLSFGILPEELCEDRSLDGIESKPDSSQEENFAILRQGKDAPSLTLFYEMLITPVSDLLDEPEIIIVPDRRLCRVPFSALLDGNSKYLTETFRIRVVPSLTTLKLIQDSPADYHSQTGALVVGDPRVGEVIYRGRLNKKFVPLPGARKEAEMIGLLLGVQPLLGQHATKQAVLERIKSVSLIHIAAHGNAERGEIALAPPGSTSEIPQEDDYLLKMSEISQVQVRAKLVVLSCCHSGRGQIRTEGVVGIARAFLGSGARSVLVALWALEDKVTEQLMNCFYGNLVRGKSTSESLHEAIKWTRDKGFTKVEEWAPFMLIGDNVTFAFGK